MNPFAVILILHRKNTVTILHGILIEVKRLYRRDAWGCRQSLIQHCRVRWFSIVIVSPEEESRMISGKSRNQSGVASQTGRRNTMATQSLVESCR